MLSIQYRIDQLEDAKQYVYNAGSGTVELTSFLQILDHHINLLKEVRDLALAMESDDVEHVKQWLENRLQEKV